MKENKILSVFYVLCLVVMYFFFSDNEKRNKQKYIESLKEIRLEQKEFYRKIDSLYTEYDKLDSINFEYKKKELIRNAEYQELKVQYNILKYENKNKNTPIKQFNVAQLDSFWNSMSGAR